MGFIKQFQRRAIEEIYEIHHLPMDIDKKELTCEDGTQLYTLGISRGYGTCSDILNTNVLVLSCIKPLREGRRPSLTTLPLAYAVLLRKATLEEYDLQRVIHSSQVLMCVELLVPRSIDCHQVTFALSGKRAYYIALC